MPETETLREHRKAHRILIRSIILILILCCFMAAAAVLKIRKKDTDSGQTANAAENTNTIADILEQAQQMEQENINETGAVQAAADAQGYAAPHMEAGTGDPLSTDPVKISDTYTQAGKTVQFKCYYPEAQAYYWETYNISEKKWEAGDAVQGMDELHRPVSVFPVTAAEGTQDMMVRCTIRFADGEDSQDIASLYVIPDITDISSGMKEDDKYNVNAGRYLSSREIPVNVTYQDGTTEALTGIDGLSFVERTETREMSSDAAGNITETVTTVNTEHEYSYIGIEDKELLLRYRSGDDAYDIKLPVSGEDLEAPEITDVEVSGFTVSNTDTPVTASVTIHAEDNETPYPYLEYAFMPGETQPQETDWVKKMSFEKEITQNGVWTAYCRDQSGNTACVEKEIIAIDQKAPVITVRLEHTDWCQSNKIIVDAEDALSVSYSFNCPETGEESGWTSRNEYEVSNNGTWKVQAKDAAGNTASKDITVSNIDKQMPVIKGITEGEYRKNEED